MKYEYDETGANFSYFILSLLILVLVPYTIYFIKSLGGKKEKPAHAELLLNDKKKARLQAKKSNNNSSLKIVFLILGWVLVGLLVVKVMHTPVDYVEWDPYQIMDLKKSATPAQIKKQYKMLGLKYHPDKVEEKDRAAAEDRWIEITKAYKVLTDDEARRNFEEYGHPDGKQSFSLGIALPAWLAESKNSFIVLVLYSSVFAIALPVLVHKWWKNSKSYTRDKLLQTTMAKFYHEVKEKTSINGLLDIIANSPEYECNKIQNANMGVASVEQALTELNDKVKLSMSSFSSSDRWDKTKKYRQDNPRAFRTALLLHAHLYRVQIDNPKLQEEQESVIEYALRLLGGILQISVAHSWLDVTMNCIELGQLIVQAMPPHQNALFQLPYITPEIIKHCETKKRSITTIKDLLNLSEEDRRSLLRTLEDDQYNEVVEVAKSFPRIKVTNVEFKVLGEREDEAAIAPGVFVTCFIKLRQIRYDEPETVEGEEVINTEIDEVEEKKKKMRTLFDNATNPNDPIYAPYLMMEKRPGWWLMMGNPQVNKSLTPPTKINDLSDEKVLRFTFQTPPKTGTYPITLYVKSDCSLGFDIAQEVKLVVVPAPKYHVFEDEISEPEEDSLAGQLAAMKQEMANEKAKKLAKKNQKNAEDDEDEDSTDYESSDDE